MGSDHQRLGLVIRNTANSQITVHFHGFLFKLGAERRIFDIMDRPVKTFLSIHRHTAPAGSQMRMIVRTEK